MPELILMRLSMNVHYDPRMPDKYLVLTAHCIVAAFLHFSV